MVQQPTRGSRKDRAHGVSAERFYAYLVTDVWGTQVGKVEPGHYMLEREYKGNGSYTWTIYDFGKRNTPLSALITGRYVGIVHGENGQLDEASKAFLTGEQAQGETP